MDGDSLRLEDLINLGEGRTKIEIADKSLEKLR